MQELFSVSKLSQYVQFVCDVTSCRDEVKCGNIKDEPSLSQLTSSNLM